MSNKQNSPIKRCTYYIDGMHCASCEVLIEKKLLKQENVETVEASLPKNRVEFTYTNEKPSLDQVNKLFEENGYTFSDRKIAQDKSLPMIQVENGSLYLNTDKLKRFFTTLILIFFLLGLFYAVDRSGIAASVTVDSNSSYFAFLLFGVLAGLSSCAALVGGLLLSLSKQWSETYIDSDSTWQRMKPFTMFNIGRVVSFFILGGVLGLIGGALGISVTSSSLFTSLLIIAVALLMAIMGLQMLGVEWAAKFQIKAPKFLTHKIANEQNFSGKYMPFLVGALTFLLPCGFTLVAQGLALTSGSFLTGALIMFFFALGTLPMLTIIGFSSASFVTKPKINIIFNAVAGILLILFSLYNVNAQLNLLGVPSLSDINLNFASKGNISVNNDPVAVNDKGVQELTVTAQGFSYTPTSSMTLKAGIQTTLIVDNKGMQGCGTYISARGLMDGYVALEPGINTIDLGTPAAGTYKITCSMGMVSPVTVTVL